MPKLFVGVLLRVSVCREFVTLPVPNHTRDSNLYPQAYESFGGLQAVTDHPTMWVGLGLLKEKEACEPGVTAAKRRRLLAQVGAI